MKISAKNGRAVLAIGPEPGFQICVGTFGRIAKNKGPGNPAPTFIQEGFEDICRGGHVINLMTAARRYSETLCKNCGRALRAPTNTFLDLFLKNDRK